MINVTRFDPRADYFGNLVDDLFKGFLVRPVTYADRREGLEAVARVKVDVTERNGAYLVHAELPGVKKEDIQLSVDGAQVTLTAECCMPSAPTARSPAASRCRRRSTRPRCRRSSPTACSS